MEKEDATSSEGDTEALAAMIVAHLEALDDNDCPYVDANDLKSTLIDGRVDMIALSEAIIRHIRATV